jgi:hypothetical protein
MQWAIRVDKEQRCGPSADFSLVNGAVGCTHSKKPGFCHNSMMGGDNGQRNRHD